MECKYCKKILKTKYTLLNHQKNTKYCLKIQGVRQTNIIYKCKFCNYDTTTKGNLERHKKKCKESKIILKNKNLELLEKYKNIEKELEFTKKELKENSKKQIKDLQDKLENIAIKAVSKPTTVNNRNIHINQVVNNLKQIGLEEVKKCGDQLTLDYHKRGAEGYAQFAKHFLGILYNKFYLYLYFICKIIIKI